MTTSFYLYLRAKDYTKRGLLWLEGGWWGVWDQVGKGFEWTVELLFDRNKHRGADESYAEVLHGHIETLDRTAEVGLYEEDITAALDLADALDVMERSTVEQFNAGFEAAMGKFLASGEFGPVTDTGEHLMVKMEMSVWVNEQVDQIRSLGTELTEACRNS